MRSLCGSGFRRMDNGIAKFLSISKKIYLPCNLLSIYCILAINTSALEQTAILDHLYEGCKANNRRAQEMLYRALASKMLGVCMRYAKNRAEAEDILQTGFVRVFTQMESFRGEGSFEGWIRRVIINTAIEAYRKSGRSVQVSELAEADSLVDGVVIDTLACEDLLAVIRALPPGYRMVFNMYAIEGYS